MLNLEYIEESMRASKYNFGEIANKVGITPEAMWRYRNGTRTMPSDVLDKLIDLLDLNVEGVFIMDKEVKPLEVSVKHLSGTWREIADRARTTIGLDEGDKEVSSKYMRKMYLCEHSPIRIETYIVKFTNLPYWVSVHFSRHKIGVEHFVSTQRTDRTGTSSRGLQDEPVTHEMVLNAQAIINISRKRLCMCASKETREAWKQVIDELEKINPTLARCCVPDCVYRGHCYEHKSCGLHQSDKFMWMIDTYREGINGYE